MCGEMTFMLRDGSSLGELLVGQHLLCAFVGMAVGRLILKLQRRGLLEFSGGGEGGIKVIDKYIMTWVI